MRDAAARKRRADGGRPVDPKATLRRLLDALGKRRRLSNDDREVLFENVRAEARRLPSDATTLDALDAVVGKNVARARDATFILGALAHVPGAEVRLLERLRDASAEVRLEVITAAHQASWTHLAPLLAERLAVERDPSCRNELIAACGDLRTPETLAALLACARADAKKKSDERGAILFHLRKHRSPRSRAYFQKVFDVKIPEPAPRFDDRKAHKVLAAWALAKLGDAAEAHAYLVKMLDDPRVEHVWDGGRGVDPGESRRAAQALADLGDGRARPRRP